MSQPPKIIRHSVLIADDSESDRFFLRHAFATSSQFSVIGEVANGVETLAYLGGVGKYADRGLYPFPDLLILDIEMPYANGFQVLGWIHECNIQGLCVAMFSDALDSTNTIKALAMGADFCYRKPRSTEGLGLFIRELELFIQGRQKS